MGLAEWPVKSQGSSGKPFAERLRQLVRSRTSLTVPVCTSRAKFSITARSALDPSPPCDPDTDPFDNKTPITPTHYEMMHGQAPPDAAAVAAEASADMIAHHTLMHGQPPSDPAEIDAAASAVAKMAAVGQSAPFQLAADVTQASGQQPGAQPRDQVCRTRSTTRFPALRRQRS